MTSFEKIRVMIADDHPIVCRGLSAIIRAERGMTVVGEASDGRQLVQIFRELQPDVTLIEAKTAARGGRRFCLAACRLLRPPDVRAKGHQFLADGGCGVALDLPVARDQ